ncbi:helix-turn-helix transcriptional regulator [Nitratireductor luteus]|uniref:helix-turn-helix transcriptional regulator n=1 Tax=Nitratireductor luteus TaxID=2976980 RepID=UPI00223F26FA|nr:response regulator transcription factor [Nitratireductor luteus]
MMQRMSGASAASQVTLAFPTTIKNTYHRKLLFVAPPGCVSDALIAAVEREFSWISVAHVLEPGLACARFDSEVQLILVDVSQLEAFRNSWSELAGMHPHAAAAVMMTAQDHRSTSLTQIKDFQAARGILPMDVNLDIWLSIIRIMLKGGAYFPSARLPQAQQASSAGPGLRAEGRPHRLTGHEQWSETMDDLTMRELEVLAMVARGYQNKIIAADLNLSEHTVKIHLHNIIRKLGVHNRTEAAAMYFDYTSRRENVDDGDNGSGQDAPVPRNNADDL